VFTCNNRQKLKVYNDM